MEAPEHLADILETIVPAKASWDSILEYLKVPKSQIESFRTENMDNVMRLADGLTTWLHHASPDVVLAHNWQTILAALRDDKVGHSRLADAVEDNFRQKILEERYPTFIPATKELCSSEFGNIAMFEIILIN